MLLFTTLELQYYRGINWFVFLVTGTGTYQSNGLRWYLP